MTVVRLAERAAGRRRRTLTRQSFRSVGFARSLADARIPPVRLTRHPGGGGWLRAFYTRELLQIFEVGRLRLLPDPGQLTETLKRRCPVTLGRLRARWLPAGSRD